VDTYMCPLSTSSASRTPRTMRPRPDGYSAVALCRSSPLTARPLVALSTRRRRTTTGLFTATRLATTGVP